jgi:16S rRNA (cytosine1402-N4)-methyltransferase
MLDAALAGLAVHADGLYVDATYGRGGHTAEILGRLQGGGGLHAFDQDPQACAHARHSFGDRPNFRIHSANFAHLGEVASEEGWSGKVAGVLFDLGVSSPQLDDAARGFSFLREGPLDMRMNPQAGVPASEWLATAEEAEIADVLWRLGEERHSRRIARAIVASGAEEPILTTTQLAELIARVMPGPRQKIHPATRSFQAIRLFINGELDVLVQALRQATAVLEPGGRLVVISFHSLEDRIVKRFIRDAVAESSGNVAPEAVVVPSRFSRLTAAKPRNNLLKAVSRHFPDDDEIAINPRARSAVLRVAEKCRPGETA